MRFTIHQPMLYPPIYLWARFASCEKLVLLGTDYCKQDGWHSRFKLNGKNNSVVITCPLQSRFGKQINEVQFAGKDVFFKNLSKTLKQLYGKQPYLTPTEQLLQP